MSRQKAAQAVIIPAAMQREPRRAIRFDARVPRTVEWEDASGQTHKAECQTRTVGAFGCKLVLPQSLPLGQRVHITDGSRFSTVTGTVVWKGREVREGWELAVELLAPNVDFWVREPQLPPAEERRRGQRAVLRLPVALHYQIRDRAPMSVTAHTVSVNDHGALVLCARAFPPGTRIELENKRTWKKLVCTVRRSPQETPEGFHLSLEFEQPALDFWPVAFPPPQ